MKQFLSTALALVLLLSLLVGSLSVSAERYEFKENVPADDWVRPAGSIEELTATDMLAPSNPNANQESKNLLAYLNYVGNSSEQIICGAFDIALKDQIWDQLKGQYGLSPALHSVYYRINDPTVPASYSQEHEMLELMDVDVVNAIVKEHYDEGAIPLVFAASYEEAIADYIVKNGIADSAANGCMHFDITNPDRNMEVYALWKNYVDGIVSALQKLEASGVKSYLIRHFIEFLSSGRHINGTDDVGYAAFIRVQQQFFDSLVAGGLEGFLLTWSPNGWGTGHALGQQRYPGNDYVDVLSITIYSDRVREGAVDQSDFTGYDFFCATGKPIGMSELSARTSAWKIAESEPRSSWWNTLKSLTSLFPRLAYMTAWGNGGYSMIHNDGTEMRQENVSKGGNDDGLLFMASPYMITLDEQPDYRTGVIDNPGIAQLFKTADNTGKYLGLEERVYNADELQELGMSISDIGSIHTTDGYAITFYSEKDAAGDSWSFTSGSSYKVEAATAKKSQSIAVSTVPNVALERDVWASSNEENVWKVNDGTEALWEGKADAKGEAWVMMDLGQTYALERYVLDLAGSANMLVKYNLRGYRLEISDDGESWTTVDTVTDNTASSINRQLKNVKGRYVRLYITDPNSSDMATEKLDVIVAELELYGVPTVEKVAVQDPGSDEPAVDDSFVGEDTSADDEPAEDTDDADAEEEPTTESTKVVTSVKRRAVTNWALVYGMIGGGVALVAAACTVILIIIRKKKQVTN